MQTPAKTSLIKNQQISDINYLYYNYIGVSEIREAIICVTIIPTINLRTSDGSIYRYRIDIAILGSRYYRIDIAILRSRYFCFRYSNMNTLISILIVKMQVSTINCLKFLSIPTHWSVGRSNEQSVDRSVGRSVGQLSGRPVN